MGQISRQLGCVLWPWVSCLKVCVPSTVDLLYSEQDPSQPKFCLLWPQSTKVWFSFKHRTIKTCTLTWFSFSSIASILAILVKWAKSHFRELRSSSQLGETSDYLGLAFCLAEQTLSAPSLGLRMVRVSSLPCRQEAISSFCFFFITSSETKILIHLTASWGYPEISRREKRTLPWI